MRIKIKKKSKSRSRSRRRKRDLMRNMAGVNMLQRMKFNSQISQMAAGGAALPRLRSEGRTSHPKRVHTQDKRKAREKKR